LAFDMSGSYQIVFLLFIANYLIAATLTFVAREPSAPGEQQTAAV
jgi:hypothetical protein